MVSDVSINTALNQQSKTAAADNKLGEDFAQFLNLLTVQLQNQDPLSPMDTTEFTNQLVSFTGVEQQINSNQKLDSLVSLGLGNAMSGALNFVGLDVNYLSSELAYEGRPVDISYAINKEISEGMLRIYDGDGTLVFETEANTGPGNHTFVWDGTDKNGNALPDGTYGVVVDALSPTGEALDVNTVVQGRVRGVETQDGLVYLLVGERAISQATVLNANYPAVNDDAPDAGAGSDTENDDSGDTGDSGDDGSSET